MEQDSVLGEGLNLHQPGWSVHSQVPSPTTTLSGSGSGVLLLYIKSVGEPGWPVEGNLDLDIIATLVLKRFSILEWQSNNALWI